MDDLWMIFPCYVFFNKRVHTFLPSLYVSVCLMIAVVNQRHAQFRWGQNMAFTHHSELGLWIAIVLFGWNHVKAGMHLWYHLPGYNNLQGSRIHPDTTCVMDVMASPSPVPRPVWTRACDGLSWPLSLSSRPKVLLGSVSWWWHSMSGWRF